MSWFENRAYRVADAVGLGEALRYVELNPVRAGLAGAAADWPWSSAAAHLSGRDRTGLLDLTEWGSRWSRRSRSSYNR